MLNNKKNKNSLIKLCLIATIFCYLGYVLFTQQIKLNRLKQEQLFYSKKLEKGYQQTEELKRIKEMCKSEEYIEKVSREQLGMVKPDEKVYIDATK